MRVAVAGEAVVDVGPSLGHAVGRGHESTAGGDDHLDVGGILGLDRSLRRGVRGGGYKLLPERRGELQPH